MRTVGKNAVIKIHRVIRGRKQLVCSSSFFFVNGVRHSFCSLANKNIEIIKIDKEFSPFKEGITPFNEELIQRTDIVVE